MEGVREYKVWTKVEEHVLVKCMRDMTDRRLVEKGNFRATGLKELERMLHERVENCQFLAVPHIKSKVRYFKDKFTASHPKATGLNNKPLLHWEDLCVIYGVDQAIGADAVQPSDAASRLVGASGAAIFMDEDTVAGGSFDLPPNLTHTEVMEEIINHGIDLHATGLKHVEDEVTSKRTRNRGNVLKSSGSKRSRQQLADEERAEIAAYIAMTTENIAKIATNYCIEGDLAVKRQSLYQELAKFGELSSSQRNKVLRHLNRDDGDCTTFFQFPTDEEKLEFVWSIIE
ncbi:hypothetical protein LINPERHAP2_LOCUS30278 [Linum perenne]